MLESLLDLFNTNLATSRQAMLSCPRQDVCDAAADQYTVERTKAAQRALGLGLAVGVGYFVLRKRS